MANPMPSNPKKPPRPSNGQRTPAGEDPYIYASLLSAFMTDRNPVQMLLSDIGRLLKLAMNFGKTRQLAQARIEHLQNQVNKIEHLIDVVNPTSTGSRINKLR